MVNLGQSTVDIVKAGGSLACGITIGLGAVLELLFFAFASDNELREFFR